MKELKLGLGKGKNEERGFYKESGTIALKGLKYTFDFDSL